MSLKTSPLALSSLLLGLALPVKATLVHSGFVDIAIPATFDGVYIDLDTGVTSTTPFAGWDINAYFGGSEIANSAAFQPVRVGSTNFDAIRNVAAGTLVEAGSSFFATGFGLSDSHVGAGSEQFLPNFMGDIAFKFTANDNSGPFYGWLRLVVTANTARAYVHDWAYEDTGAPTPVPEPAAWAALIGAGALAMARLRRRRA